MRRVLITGGAGFIGSHLADELIAHGYAVRALDLLHEQIHGSGEARPDYLHPEVELVVGDVTNPSTVRRSLDGVDLVVHLAARVGIAQSMPKVASFARVNCLGTAVLLEELRSARVSRLVVASTMSVYGEGLYLGVDQRFRSTVARTPGQLQHRMWEPFDEDGRPLHPVLTPEWKRPDLTSAYAVTKYAQERMCLLAGEASRMPTVALRLFNVYGPRQAPSNPYTGVLTNFASRLLRGEPPLVYEDGRQKRDFIHVRDVARAFKRALEKPGLESETINVGSGRAYPVGDVARRLADVMGLDIEPLVTEEFRTGDVRHCFADPSRAERVLDFEARVDFDDGLAELIAWVEERAPREVVVPAV